MPRLLRTGIVALFLALVVACGDPTDTQEPLATLGSTATPPPLPAEDISSNVSDSVASIETPILTGSGVLSLLSEETYVITNAHVIWPFEKARIVFSNGSEHLDVPVIGVDLMGDLAAFDTTYYVY